jgi:hypothetical protein
MNSNYLTNTISFDNFLAFTIIIIYSNLYLRELYIIIFYYKDKTKSVVMKNIHYSYRLRLIKNLNIYIYHQNPISEYTYS